MRWVYLVLLVIAVAIIVAFVLENHENTTVKIFRQSLTATPLVVFCRGVLSGHVERRDCPRLL
jgi:hypothetical protein